MPKRRHDGRWGFIKGCSRWCLAEGRFGMNRQHKPISALGRTATDYPGDGISEAGTGTCDPEATLVSVRLRDG